jgi:hypothetical protein
MVLASPANTTSGDQAHAAKALGETRGPLSSARLQEPRLQATGLKVFLSQSLAGSKDRRPNWC